MALTSSTHGSVIKATAATDEIPGKKFKALMWVLSSATVGTDRLQVTEGVGAGGHVIYDDYAPKTDGTVAIPCPEGKVDNLYITTLGNGYVLAYPIK